MGILEISGQLNFLSYDNTPGCHDELDMGSDDSPPPLPGSGFQNWCSCGICVPMSSALECICCRSVAEVVAKETDRSVTLNEDFGTLCLNVAVLQVAYCYVRNVAARPETERSCGGRPGRKRLAPVKLKCLPKLMRALLFSGFHCDIIFYRKYRYVAYRQFAHSVWGTLGKDNRRVLPSCVVNQITM